MRWLRAAALSYALSRCGGVASRPANRLACERQPTERQHLACPGHLSFRARNAGWCIERRSRALSPPRRGRRQATSPAHDTCSPGRARRPRVVFGRERERNLGVVCLTARAPRARQRGEEATSEGAGSQLCPPLPAGRDTWLECLLRPFCPFSPSRRTPRRTDTRGGQQRETRSTVGPAGGRACRTGGAAGAAAVARHGRRGRRGRRGRGR